MVQPPNGSAVHGASAVAVPSAHATGRLPSLIDGQVVGLTPGASMRRRHEVREGSLCGCRCCRENPSSLLRTLRGTQAAGQTACSGCYCQGVGI